MFSQRILLTLLISAPLAAQSASTDLRQVYCPVFQPGSLNPTELGNLYTPPASGSNTSTLEWRNGASLYSSVNLPLHRVGNVMRLSATDYLVAGRRHTASGFVGHLVRARLDLLSPSITITESTDIGAVDPLELCFDALGQDLFVLDARERQVLAASWSPSGPLPAAFSPVVDYTSLGALARPYYTAISPAGAGGVRVFESNKVVYTRYYESGQQWAADTSAWLGENQRPSIVADNLFVPVNQPWVIEVVGPATFPLPVTIEAEGGVNISAQLTGPTTTLAALGLQQTPGDFGSIDISTGGKFDFRTCVRYGVSQNTSFYNLSEVYCDTYGPYAGRENMVVSVDVLPSAVHGTSHPSALVGALWVGVRSASGSDPVTVSGSSAILTPVASVPFSVPAGDLPGDLSFALPTVPTAAAGAVLLFQVVVSDGVQIAYSDVFGIETRSSNPWGT